jgi:hypothetical protein
MLGLSWDTEADELFVDMQVNMMSHKKKGIQPAPT